MKSLSIFASVVAVSFTSLLLTVSASADDKDSRKKTVKPALNSDTSKIKSAVPEKVADKFRKDDQTLPGAKNPRNNDAKGDKASDQPPAGVPATAADQIVAGVKPADKGVPAKVVKLPERKDATVTDTGKTNKGVFDQGFGEKTKTVPDNGATAGAGGGNLVNQLTSDGLGGPLGNTAATGRTGIAGQGTAAISEAPVVGTMRDHHNATNEAGSDKGGSGPSTRTVRSKDGSTTSTSSDGRNKVVTDKDGNKTVIVVHDVFQKDAKGNRVKDENGNSVLVPQEEIVGTIDANGNITPGPPPEKESETKPVASPLPPGEGEGTVAGKKKFREEHPTLFDQVSQAKQGKPASQGGGGDVTPVPNGENLPVRSGVIDSRNHTVVGEKLLGNPGERGGLGESGAPRTGPDYNNDAGAIDLGRDTVQTSAGGREQNPGDVMAGKPAPPPPAKKEDDSSDSSSTDDAAKTAAKPAKKGGKK